MSAAATRQGPDPALVASARDGDRQALDALVAASLPLVYNIVGRALRGHADVDDVVQDTMLRLVRGLAELKDPAAYRSWLAAIALRQARDHGRRTSAAVARTAAYDVPSEPADPGSDFAGVTVLRLGLTDQRRDVAEATRWLDPEDRELLSLWWLEESGRLGRRELAEALGLSGPHAAVRVHRMKRQLDTARSVVGALRDASACADLPALAADWDGMPSPLWRKRFARHVRGCDHCTPQQRSLVPVARLLRGMPLVPVPVALATQFGGSRGRVQHESQPSRRSARSRRAGRARPRGLAAGHPLAAALGAAAVVAAIVAGYILYPRASAAPTAAVTQAATAASVIPTSPGTTSAAASPSPTTPGRTASASAKASATASATRANAAGAATTATRTSSRKGVSIWQFAGAGKALGESGASWYYSWSSADKGVSAPGVGFVPMIWGADDVTSAELAQAEQSTTCGCVLGFNEPDWPGQSDMPVSKALSLWPKLQATGLQLGSPAVAANGATAGGWLDRFMAGAKADGYRVDFITLHWYGSDFSVPDAVGQLQAYIEAVHARYHLPIWLTEFALIAWPGGVRQYPGEATEAAFLTAATKMLDALPYVRRYAWFGLGASGQPSSGLFLGGPAVTPVGAAFEAAR